MGFQACEVCHLSLQVGALWASFPTLRSGFRSNYGVDRFLLRESWNVNFQHRNTGLSVLLRIKTDAPAFSPCNHWTVSSPVFHYLKRVSILWGRKVVRQFCWVKVAPQDYRPQSRVSERNYGTLHLVRQHQYWHSRRAKFCSTEESNLPNSLRRLQGWTYSLQKLLFEFCSCGITASLHDWTWALMCGDWTSSSELCS